MSQVTPPSEMAMASATPKGSRDSNVYTVLALVAVLALGAAAGFVAWKNTQLTGDSNPFFIVKAEATR